MTAPTEFGQRLHRLRRERGWTQSELAKLLGLDSHAHVSNLETGRKAPSLDLALRIAALFGLSLDALLNDEPVAAVRAVSPSLDDPELRQLHEHPSTYTPATPSRDMRTQHFGTNLRALRQQAGLTQTELAQRLDLTSHVFVSQLESGRKPPSLDLLRRVATVFDTPIDQLLTERASGEPPRTE